MKKTFRILSVMALACLVVFGSCKKNENENNNSTNENGTLSAGIVQPNNGAKTSITINGSEGIIKWTAGDQILVGDASQSGTFTLLEGAGESTAVFRCPNFPVDELAYYTAAYPASAATVNGTAVTFNIPAEQTLTRIEDGFGNGANPMVAYATAPLDQLEFKSVFGGVGIKLQAPVPASITKLVLTDNNNYLCGQFSVADVTVDEPFATHVSGGGHSITLNLPEGGLRVDSQGCNVYIMLPVGALSNGFTLDAYVGETRVTNKDTDSSAATITLNNINNAVTYNVELPAGKANTAEAVMALANDSGYTGPIEIVSGTLDFAGLTSAEQPLTQQIVIAQGAEVEISNLSATSTSGTTPAMVVQEGATVTMTGVNLKTTSTASDARPINIENNTNVTITGSTIEAVNGAYSRALNIYGANAVVTVTDSQIKNARYAVNLPSSATNVSLTMDNVIIEGWAAINVWGGPNHQIIANNCTLKGTNTFAGSSNTFATIVVNVDCVNNLVQLNNCDITAKSTVSSKQYLGLISGTGNNTIEINGGTITGETTNTGDNLFALKSSGSDFNINVDIEDENVNWDGSLYGGGKGMFQGKPSMTPNQEVVVSSNESIKD